MIRCRLQLILVILQLAVIINWVTPVWSFALPQRKQGDPFAVPPGLEGRVEFWRLLFTKYGKDQRVFHYREHPEVIYSVLDFSDYEKTLSGKGLREKKEQEVEKEISRIKFALNRLGRGQPPSNPFEKRLKLLFDRVPGGNSKFLAAAEDRQIRYQAGIRERFREGLVRSGRYLYAIEGIFRSEGLPVELGRLPLVESSFDYEAYSSVGAAGIWQFMRETAKRYMQVGSAIDERRDPIISSRAAAQYLKNSYAKLGNWPLAVTSYNHGLSGVMRAVKSTGSTDLKTIIRKYEATSFGFASGNFYAEFLAALHVERNSNRYFPGLVRDQPIYFDELRLAKSTYFRDIVRGSNTSKDDLYWLNRGFREPILRSQTPIPAGTQVKVPQGKGVKLLAALGGGVRVGFPVQVAMNTQDINSTSNSQGTTSVPLISLDKDMEITVAPKAKESNKGNISQRARLQDSKDSFEATSETKRIYLVRSGDTIATIARKFSVSSEALVIANDIANPESLKPGQKIEIPKKTQHEKVAQKQSAREVAPNQEFHVVAKGETISAIAKKYDLTTKELLKMSGVDDARKLKPGMKLALKTSETNLVSDNKSSKQSAVAKDITASKKSQVSSTQDSIVNVDVTYVVVKGDTLVGIGKKTGVPVVNLKQLNPGLKAEKLKPGQKIVLK